MSHEQKVSSKNSIHKGVQLDNSDDRSASLGDMPAKDSQGAKEINVTPEDVMLMVRKMLESAQPIESRSFPNQPLSRGEKLPMTLPNVERMLKHEKIVVLYDLVKKRVRLYFDGYEVISDNADSFALTVIKSLAALNGLIAGNIKESVGALAEQNPYNPVAEWIGSKPWDGRDRIPDICATLQEREGFPASFKDTLTRKWLLSAVAAALMPRGFHNRGVLTLQGPQGIGKTSWFRSLVSDARLREMVVKLDHLIDPSPRGKDTVIGAITHWICELGELEATFKKSGPQLKSFLTSDFDKIRRPYGDLDSEYSRRTVFGASVNEAAFLVDSTGNTRIWTIPVVYINYQHTVDMQQLYAQLAEDFRAGAEWWLSKDEEAVLERLNAGHRTVSAVYEKIVAVLDLNRIGEQGLPWQSATEVLKRIGIKDPENRQSKDANQALREILGDSHRIQGRNVWRVPYRKSSDGLD